ncbi:MAG: C2H2-type zinc finger protein [Nitrososphaeraceae archaeon]
MEIECDECDEKFKNKEFLGKHLKKEHKKAFCGACRNEFKTKELLEEHIRNFHLINTRHEFIGKEKNNDLS